MNSLLQTLAYSNETRKEDSEEKNNTISNTNVLNTNKQSNDNDNDNANTNTNKIKENNNEDNTNTNNTTTNTTNNIVIDEYALPYFLTREYALTLYEKQLKKYNKYTSTGITK